MSNMKYSIRFYSPWHCGSGLSAGADVDALVIKDRQGMPYIPGKTLKGLIREAVEEYASLSGKPASDEITRAFGLPANANEPNVSVSGQAFFTDGNLDKREYDAIAGHHAQRFLYNKVSSTAIGEDGIAEEHSLRSIETVVPCTLYAEVYDLPDAISAIFHHCIGLIHHIGLNRSRGLGRCDFKLEEGGNR